MTLYSARSISNDWMQARSDKTLKRNKTNLSMLPGAVSFDDISSESLDNDDKLDIVVRGVEFNKILKEDNL